MSKTKDDLAYEMYDEAFDELSPGQKARVTKAFKDQPRTRATTTEAVSTPRGAVTAEIGRIGVNGTKKCILHAGATIRELIQQSGLPALDERKEGVIAQSSGSPVSLSSVVQNGEVYMIAVEISSA